MPRLNQSIYMSVYIQKTTTICKSKLDVDCRWEEDVKPTLYNNVYYTWFKQVHIFHSKTIWIWVKLDDDT